VLERLAQHALGARDVAAPGEQHTEAAPQAREHVVERGVARLEHLAPRELDAALVTEHRRVDVAASGGHIAEPLEQHERAQRLARTVGVVGAHFERSVDAGRELERAQMQRFARFGRGRSLDQIAHERMDDLE
jgi:hypothetical protein